MKPTIYRIEMEASARLAIVARPRGGDWLCDEIRALAAEGIELLVSMLTAEEAEELGLRDEESECQAAVIRFVNIPVQDRSVPVDRLQFLKSIAPLAAQLRDGKSIAVHCRAGIGRSFLLAASLMIFSGVSPEETFQRIQKARGCLVPDTPEQREWVLRNVTPG